MTNAEIIQRLELLTDAINALTQAMGVRLTRAQMCERLKISRNTMTKRVKEPGFPLPDKHGFWFLADVMQWERNSSKGRS
ncbi:AlpA family transcriptional regulator [Limnohabitans sp. WS1]|uniref:helix-turn-helix transcriptional regulator n=1 Tax=Limnohabitans sp. WS1 TaxID=1100726 RepID=UPI000D36BD11|nr:hypothetical protein [Limnohabitans sp. WS1]PUE06155.1 hypothetical protein B9Z48_20470 [Limnohabitans sp. WS1]